jgi:hypothetical protein
MSKKNGYFSLELAITLALFLPCALCIFDTMRYLISHTILNRAVARVAAAADKEALSIQQIGERILTESSILLPIKGFSCDSKLNQTQGCCNPQDVSCLGISVRSYSATRYITAVYKVDYLVLDSILGRESSAAPLLRGDLAIHQEIWKVSESPEEPRIEDGILNEAEEG